MAAVAVVTPAASAAVPSLPASLFDAFRPITTSVANALQARDHDQVTYSSLTRLCCTHLVLYVVTESSSR
jgi:ABC-type phosphate transport system permease subunit